MGRETAEKLAERMDSLTQVLKKIIEDLEEVKVKLKTGAVQEKFSTLEDVQKMFPENLAKQVYFEQTEEYVIVRPKGYLGQETFRQVATIVTDKLGGEYVSAGKDSHFRVPRKH